MVSPCQSMISRSPAVTSPMTTASTSHLAQTARKSSTWRGSTTAIIRSCDSLIKISSGDRVESRSGTRSRSTCIPPSPALANSEVAHESPAPPRSWMPATNPAANSSRVHSISNFSMNGSPTWTLGRLAGPVASKVSLASTLTPPMPSPPVAAPYKITRLPRPGGLGQVQVFVPENADAQRVDQRVAGVRPVEHHLAADVGQAQAVAVAADAGHDSGQHPRRVGGVEGPEPQRIHHPDRTRAHGQDVPDDAADSGGRPLVGLDVAGVVVRFDLERHCVALTDVDHPGVLADARQRLADRRFVGQLAEAAEVDLGRLVRAVLRPHHRVHGQLRRRRPATEELADAFVLVLLQAEL